jgi:integrase
MGRFPSRQARIAKHRHLQFHVEAFLNELYILGQRLLSLLNFIERQHRRDPRLDHIKAVWNALCEHPKHGLVFSTGMGTPFDRHNLVNRQLKPTCKKFGLIGVSWHWLRHANATLLNAVGAPLGTVQALLGHSSSEITREVYLHSIPADARAAVQNVEDLLIGPKLTQVKVSLQMGSLLIQ